MGYERNDRRYGYGRDNDRPEGRYGRGGDPRYGDPEDRGFFDRAGDEVRSWFGDEEAERRRRLDERYDERYDRERSSYPDGGRYARYQAGGYSGPTNTPRWQRSNQSSGGRYSGNYAPYSYHYSGPDEDRQFGTDYSENRGFGYGDYNDAGFRYGTDDNWRDTEYRAIYGRRQNQESDPHGYHSWRDRQVHALDRDYDEYRRENQSRFESEFSTWRQNRQTQRDSLHQVTEHQEVVGSDGTHVGKVDHVRGDRILLTKSDRDAGGHHHSIPSSWIQTVDDKVHLSKTAEQAKQAWRDEENNRGLFGRDDKQDRGPADLNRSFSGTYRSDDR